MIPVLGSFMALVGLIGLVVAVIALIKPLPQVGLGSRRTSLIVLTGSLVFMSIGSIMVPDVSTPTTSRGAGSKPLSPVPDDKAETKIVIKKEIAQLDADMGHALNECDNAVRVVATTMGYLKGEKITVYTAYKTVGTAREICHDSWEQMQQLRPPPSATSEVRSAFSEAIDACSLSIFGKTEAFDKIKVVLNGDERPSSLEEFDDNAGFAGIQSDVCLSKVAHGASLSGYPMTLSEEVRRGAKLN